MKLNSVYILFFAIVFLISCRKRDAILPDTLVYFANTQQGITASENAITVKLMLSHGTDRDIPVVINLTEQGVAYTTDYTTSPVATAGKINLTIPSGASEASFTLTKKPGALFDGDEKIIFDIYSSGPPVLIGITKQFTLGFGELIASNTTATINGGGALFPNKVFIDLSASRQTPVQRTNWDLGFYSGSDDYRVILNSSVAMMAKQVNKNDLNAVTATDTLGFSTDVAFSQFNPVTTSLPYIDYPNGDLSRTAIAAVSATATDNKVYIVNRGNGIGNPAPARGWKKVRIIRNTGGGYTLQYADIAALTFNSIDIPKDDAYFFKYVSFENGAVTIEPQKKKWDLSWTYFSNTTNFGTGEVPYLFQDMILINRNVQIARVMTSTKGFQEFNESDLTNMTPLPFSSSSNAVASDWRSGGGPGTAPSVRTDRYYIVRDGDNNFYKLRFTALTRNGERGYPAYEVVLVKKG